MSVRLGITCSVLLIAGCGRPAPSVQGTVTFDGAPLSDGYITFFPVGEPGSTEGAPIVGGQYELRPFTPGKKRVLVTATPLPIPGEDEKKLKAIVRLPISARTPGNNVEVTLPPEGRALDLHLKKEK